MNNKQLIIGLLSLLPLPLLGAEEFNQLCAEALPESTPAEHFIVQADPATVLHTSTNLIWQRCLLGQQFNAGRCEGEPLNFVPRQPGRLTPASHDASIILEQLLSDFPGWRLANEKELLSIVEYRCIQPRINMAVFPGFGRIFRQPDQQVSVAHFIGHADAGATAMTMYRLVKNNE